MRVFVLCALAVLMVPIGAQGQEVDFNHAKKEIRDVELFPFNVEVTCEGDETGTPVSVTLQDPVTGAASELRSGKWNRRAPKEAVACPTLPFTLDGDWTIDSGARLNWCPSGPQDEHLIIGARFACKSQLKRKVFATDRKLLGTIDELLNTGDLVKVAGVEVYSLQYEGSDLFQLYRRGKSWDSWKLRDFRVLAPAPPKDQNTAKTRNDETLEQKIEKASKRASEALDAIDDVDSVVDVGHGLRGLLGRGPVDRQPAAAVQIVCEGLGPCAKTVVTVTLPVPPPSAIHCHFAKSLGEAENVSVRWEPGGIDGLTKTVTLGPGEWAFGCAATPILRHVETRNSVFDFDVSWRFLDLQPVQKGKGSKSQFFTIDVKRPALSLESGKLSISKVDDPSVGPIVIRVGAHNARGLADTARALSVRRHSFEVNRSLSAAAVSKGLQDVFELLGEIAIERARDGAFRIVQRNLKTLLCTTLVLPRENEFAMKLWGLTQQTSAEIKVLPESCRLVESVRLATLMVDLKNLYQAVQIDGLQLVWAGLLLELDKESACGPPGTEETCVPEGNIQLVRQALMQVRQVLIGLIQGRSIDPADEARTILSAMAGDAADLFGSKSVGACGLTLAFGAMSLCLEQANCGPEFVDQVIRKPREYFGQDAADCVETLKFEAPAGWADLRVLTMRGVEILRAASDASAETTLRATLNLAIDLLSRFADSEKLPLVACYLPRAAAITTGIIEHDTAKVMAALVDLMVIATSGAGATCGQPAGEQPDPDQSSEKPEAFQRAGYLLSAITRSAIAYAGASANESPEDVRKQRKEVLESVIDALTDRSQRDPGQTLYSLGAAPGFRVFGVHCPSGEDGSATDCNTGDTFGPQLALPMGIAVQKFARGSSFGLMAQLYVLDLGQFAAHGNDVNADDFQWQAAFTPGLQGAVLVGDIADNLGVGVDVHYSGGDPARKDSRFLRVGLFAFYYVPFIDLN